MKTFLQPGVWKTSLAMAKTVWRMKPALAFVGGYDRLESLTVMALSKLLRFRVGPLHDSRFNDAESFAKSIRLEWVKSLFMARYDFFMCPGKECIEYSKFLGGAGKPAYRAGWNVVDNATIAKSADDATHDAAIREHLKVPTGKRFFLMPIRFIEKKNALRVIEAFAAATKMAANPAHLTICGKGEQEEVLRKAAAMPAGQGSTSRSQVGFLTNRCPAPAALRKRPCSRARTTSGVLSLTRRLPPEARSSSPTAAGRRSS